MTGLGVVPSVGEAVAMEVKTRVVAGCVDSDTVVVDDGTVEDGSTVVVEDGMSEDDDMIEELEDTGVVSMDEEVVSGRVEVDSIEVDSIEEVLETGEEVIGSVVLVGTRLELDDMLVGGADDDDDTESDDEVAAEEAGDALRAH